jgi:hypothetical protein
MMCVFFGASWHMGGSITLDRSAVRTVGMEMSIWNSGDAGPGVSTSHIARSSWRIARRRAFAPRSVPEESPPAEAVGRLFVDPAANEVRATRARPGVARRGVARGRAGAPKTLDACANIE